MRSLKENMNGVALCLFELVVGVLLLISPVYARERILDACRHQYI